MERTYDVFADNGLFLLSYYLKKDIKDISTLDIENSISFMSEKVESFLDCDKYSNLKTMVLFNSAVSNPSLKNTKLETVLKEFINQKGNDYCMICGQNHANLQIKLKGRSYLPNRPNGTYFNFSNNLHSVNICPYCLILTTYSVMNCRSCSNVYLYNSSDDLFMKNYTAHIQRENKADILAKVKKSKKPPAKLDILLEMINFNILYDKDIEIYSFNNGKTEEIEDTDTISAKNIILLRKMSQKELLGEFRKLNLSWMILNNKIHSRYINYVYDFEKGKLKCSKELFDFLNEEVNKMDKQTKELIDKITDDLSKSKLNIDKIRTKLKGVKDLNSFKREIMDISESYYEKTDSKLFNSDEYECLVNRYIYEDIRNRIIINLM